MIDAPATQATSERRVAAVRRFNRFYTQRIGILEEGHLESPFSLAEVRVLYELAHRDTPTATEIGQELGLDAGYLSRILRGFEQRGLIERQPSPADGRQSLVRLTASGRKAFAPLDRRSNERIATMLNGLSDGEQRRLVDAMRTIQALLGALPERASSFVMRNHRPGDMGWVVHRHGVLYFQEYGYDERFEALVAKVVSDFVTNLDPKWERCWIAEREGEIVGCVFLVKESETVAKLRLLLVEPSARGLGIGRRLVGECVRLARQLGYERLTLWTQKGLDAARHLYEEAGFRLTREETHHSFGHDLTAQTWDLELER